MFKCKMTRFKTLILNASHVPKDFLKIIFFLIQSRKFDIPSQSGLHFYQFLFDAILKTRGDFHVEILIKLGEFLSESALVAFLEKNMSVKELKHKIDQQYY